LESSFERISQFSSDASHELKTPLTIIRGEIEIALRKERSIDYYKDVLNSSLNEIIIIEKTINDAIQFSHKNSQIIVKSYKKESFFEISVQDFGIGIPLNEQEKIFEKFYRTDKSRNKNSGGTGLGMSILKKIIDIHKGKININSKENVGTTITISFPIKNNF
jgi:signal transduction histidine kinase